MGMKGFVLGFLIGGAVGLYHGYDYAIEQCQKIDNVDKAFETMIYQPGRCTHCIDDKVIAWQPPDKKYILH